MKNVEKYQLYGNIILWDIIFHLPYPFPPRSSDAEGNTCVSLVFSNFLGNETMEVKTKERVGPLSRRQCELMKNYLLNGVLPSPEEIKDAGFPFFDTILSDKNSYCRHR